MTDLARVRLSEPAWLAHTEGPARVCPSWIAGPLARETTEPASPTPSHATAPPPAPAIPTKRSGPPPRISVQMPAVPAYPDLRDENTTLRAQMAELARTIGGLRGEVLRATEPEIVKLACAVAERVVGRELQTDPALIGAWVREAVVALGAPENVTVSASPDLAASLERAAVDGVRIEVDPSFPPSKCEVRTATATADAGITARVDAVRRELGVETT